MPSPEDSRSSVIARSSEPAGRSAALAARERRPASVEVLLDLAQLLACANALFPEGNAVPERRARLGAPHSQAVQRQTQAGRGLGQPFAVEGAGWIALDAGLGQPQGPAKICKSLLRFLAAD